MKRRRRPELGGVGTVLVLITEDALHTTDWAEAWLEQVAEARCEPLEQPRLLAYSDDATVTVGAKTYRLADKGLRVVTGTVASL